MVQHESEQTEISEGHYAAASGGTSTSAITAGGTRFRVQLVLTQTLGMDHLGLKKQIYMQGRVELAGPGRDCEALLKFLVEILVQVFTQVTEDFDGTSWTEVADLS